MKKSLNRRHVLLQGAWAAASLCAVPAMAQSTYPSKPITIVVGFPAGGDTDVIARMIAEKLSARLGQPVVVDNRTGAAGTIGTSHVAKSAPDGHTLLLAPNTMAITPHVLKDVASAQIDISKDLTPIVQLGTQALFVVATAASGVSNIKELIAAVKAGKITSYASPGNGSPMHILGELFDRAAGVKIAQVPYRGSVPAVADMVGGHVPMMYTTLGPVAPHLSTGKLVMLGVASPQRSPFQPNVPTLTEQGLPNADVGAWQALFGPKGMPADLVRLLNQHCNEILKMPDIVSRLQGLAVVPAGGTAAQMSKLAADDYTRYGQLVKEFGIKAD